MGSMRRNAGSPHSRDQPLLTASKEMLTAPLPHNLKKFFKLASPKPVYPTSPSPFCRNDNKGSCPHFPASPLPPDRPGASLYGPSCMGGGVPPDSRFPSQLVPVFRETSFLISSVWAVVPAILPHQLWRFLPYHNSITSSCIHIYLPIFSELEIK